MNEINKEEQVLNGFVEMMKGFWDNQDLEVPNLETLKSKMTFDECTTCEDTISRQEVENEVQ